MKKALRDETIKRQGHLRLVPPQSKKIPSDFEGLRSSIISLTQDLTRLKSQGGIDSQTQIVEYLASWLEERGLAVERIQDESSSEKHKNLGVCAEIGSGDGPIYLVTACLDTAPFGSIADWGSNPTSGFLDHKGFLYGRGTADSKVAVAIFSHLMVSLKNMPLNGNLVFLADSDEHSGRFGAIKHLVEKRLAGKISGAYIGYPGFETIKIGARGFYRSQINFYGSASHTGSSTKSVDNAIDKAVDFAAVLNAYSLPCSDDPKFPYCPKVTITSFEGGNGSYSIVPDRCTIKIDVRLTPAFDKKCARDMLLSLIKMNNQKFMGRKATISNESSWPAYRIPEKTDVVSALRYATRENLGKTLNLKVCGPSNVGNYLAANGIPAVCGFGVGYSGLHAPDENIDTETILPVYKSYHEALGRLLSVSSKYSD